MSKLCVQEKSVVVPGEIVCEGMDYLPGNGTYRKGDNIYAKRLGLVRVDGRTVKLIGLAGSYLPKKRDQIICRVVDIAFSGWRVETNSAYSAMLSLKDGSSSFIDRGADLSQIHALGDYVFCEITNVTSQKLIDVTMKGPGLKKLTGGRMIEVNAYKVPRIIGKQGSMISLIKKALNCNIVVGQNGLVWIDAEPAQELKAIDTIRYIEQHAHESGLTDKVSKLLGE